MAGRRRTTAGPRRNVEALKEIMGFWFERGIAGFRVDMAFSLVKGYDSDENRGLPPGDGGDMA